MDGKLTIRIQKFLTDRNDVLLEEAKFHDILIWKSQQQTKRNTWKHVFNWSQNIVFVIESGTFASINITQDRPLSQRGNLTDIADQQQPFYSHCPAPNTWLSCLRVIFNHLRNIIRILLWGAHCVAEFKSVFFPAGNWRTRVCAYTLQDSESCGQKCEQIVSDTLWKLSFDTYSQNTEYISVDNKGEVRAVRLWRLWRSHVVKNLKCFNLLRRRRL